MQQSVRLEQEEDVAVIIVDNPPVNALSHGVRQGLLQAIHAVAEDNSLKAVVIIGDGGFIAGADIREFNTPPVEPHLPEVTEAIDSCPKPVVAAIAGNALGGGFEIALAADHRVAATGAGVGLPEVRLGIIPGAGGTQRVPRITGAATAIDLIASGRRIGTEEALSLGLIDAVTTGDLRQAAVAAARDLKKKHRLSERSLPAPGDTETATATALRKGRGQPAVAGAIEAIEAAALPFAAGLAKERTIFLGLRSSPEAEALRHIFFAEREAPKVAALREVAPRPIERAGVIGAGTMGAGIAVAFADAGLPVTLIERDAATLNDGIGRIAKIYARSVSAGRLSEDEAERRKSLIEPAVDFDRLSRADMIVEAAFEDMAVKEDIFRRLDAVARLGATLASNTSYLDLDRIAAATARPQDVVGLHFFSPANVMRLLEVVRGAATSAETLATALAAGRRIRKLCVVAGVGEGFIGNRIFSAYRRQCEYMLEEGASPYEIDAALEAWGFPMGPFAVSDLSGLDIAWRTRQRLAATRDPRERYVAIPDRLCESGRLGRKTGAGWYRYGNGRPEPDQEVLRLVEDASAEKGIERRPFTPEEIRRRVLATMANEGAHVLSEGIAQRASDIDVTLVNGYGFPGFRGGPMFAADAAGLESVLADLEKIKAMSGFGFEIAPLLARTAGEGGKLASAVAHLAEKPDRIDASEART